MKSLVRLSILLIITPLGVVFGTLSKNYTFSTSDIDIDTVTVEGSDYHRVYLQDCYNDAFELGNPSLPVMKVRFILDPHERVDSVKITSLDSTTILSDAHPYPQQHPVPEYAPFVSESYWYSLYASPGIAAQVTGHGVSAEAHFAKVTLYPVQYDPLSNDLKLYTTVGIQLYTTGGYPLQTVVVGRDSIGKEQKEEEWKGMVENPEDVETCLEETWDEYSYFLSGEPDEKMAIITTAEFVPTFQRLAEWKTQRGLPTDVFSIPYSSNGHSVLSVVREKFEVGYDFILLGGGGQVITPRMNTFHNGLNSGGAPYTDLYYADYDSDINAWDGNGNGVYGEPYLIAIKPKDIHFVDDNTGYFIGGPGGQVGGGTGFYTVVMRTTNGGITWEDRSLTDAPAKAIYATSEDVVIAVGAAYFGIRISEDGGWNWRKVLGKEWSKMREEDGIENQLTDVDFIHADTGWAVGKRKENGINKPILFETTDGGLTWKEVDVGLQGFVFRDLDAVSSSRLWITSSEDIYRIDIVEIDDELHYTFTKDTPSEVTDWLDCSFFDEDRGVALCMPIIIGEYCHSKVFSRNSDGVWVERFSGADGHLTYVLASNDPPGRAFLFGDENHVLVSSNSYGETWTDISQDAQWPPQGVTATFLEDDPSYIWVAGYTGNPFNKNNLTKTNNAHESDIDNIIWIDSEFNIEAGDIGVAEWEPDIPLGRLPVNTVEEAELLVDKIIEYEKNPPADNFTERALFMASGFNRNGVFWYDGIKQAFGKAGDWDKDEDKTAGTLFNPRTGYWPVTDPPIEENYFEGEDILNAANARDSLNDGYNFVYHIDHGGGDMIGTGYDMGGGYLTALGDIANLTNGNKQSVFLTGACWSANYLEWSYPGGCVATEFLRNPNGGGVAYIGSVYPADNREVYSAKRYFSERLLGASDPLSPAFLGNIYQHAVNSMNLPGATNFHLLGDPSMKVWNGELKEVYDVNTEIKYNPSGDPTSLLVYVKEYVDGKFEKVHDAKVCLYMKSGPEYFSVEATKRDGTNPIDTFAKFHPAPPDGLILMTITKQNYKPHQEWFFMGECSKQNAPIRTYHDLPTDPTNTRNIAIDINGNLHLVYTDQTTVDGPKVALYAFSKDGGDEWIISRVDPNETNQTHSPTIGLHNGTTPYVAYIASQGDAKESCKLRNLSTGEDITLDIEPNTFSMTVIGGPGLCIYDPDEAHVAFRTNEVLYYRKIDLNNLSFVGDPKQKKFDAEVPDNSLWEPSGPAVGVVSYESLMEIHSEPFVMVDRSVDGNKTLYYWLPGVEEGHQPTEFCAGEDPSVSVEGNLVGIAYQKGLKSFVRLGQFDGSFSVSDFPESPTSGFDGSPPQAVKPNIIVWPMSDIYMSAAHPDIITGWQDPRWTPQVGFGTSAASRPSADINFYANLGACAWSKTDAPGTYDERLFISANTLDNFPPGSNGILPPLMVFSPQAGDYWIGGVETIKWWQEAQESGWSIEISSDGGQTWDYIVQNDPGTRNAGANYYWWQVGKLADGTWMDRWPLDNCYMKITCGSMVGISHRFTVYWNLCRIIPPKDLPGGPIPPGSPQETEWQLISDNGCSGIDLQISTDEGQSFAPISSFFTLYMPSDSSVYDTVIVNTETGEDTVIRMLYSGTIDWTVPNTPCTYNAARLKLVAQDTTGDTTSCVFGEFTIPIGGCHQNSTARDQRIMAPGITPGAVGITYTTKDTDTSQSIIRYTETSDGLSLSVPDSIGEGVLPSHSGGQVVWLSNDGDTNSVRYAYWDQATQSFSGPVEIATPTGNGYIDYAPVGIVTRGDTVHTAILRRKRYLYQENWYTEYLLELRTFLKNYPINYTADTLTCSPQQICDTTELTTPSFAVLNGKKHVAFSIGDSCIYYTNEFGTSTIQIISSGLFPTVAVYEGNVAYSYLTPDSSKFIRRWRYRDDTTWVSADTFVVPDTIECITAASGLLYAFQNKESSRTEVCLYGPLSEAFYRQNDYTGYNLHAQHIPGTAEGWYLGFTQLDNTYHFLSTRPEPIRTLYPALYLKSALTRSPYTTHRDTCTIIDNIYVDFGVDSLIYDCPRLSNLTSYSVLLEFLCDADTTSPITISVNGQVDTMWLPSEGSMWYETDLAGTSNLSVRIHRLGPEPITLRRLVVRHSDPVGYAMGGPQGDPIPEELPLCLYQPYPNPFVDAVTIRYSLPYAMPVSMKVYDVSGRLVAKLVDGEVEPGVHTMRWTGKDDINRKCAAGVYFLRFKTEEYHAAKKMVLLK